MINPFVNNGNLFYISSALPATYDNAGYSALTWTQIRGIRSIGDIGVTYETIDYNVIDGIRHNKKSGTLANSIAVEVIKIDDAGQTMLKTLIGLTSSYSFKCVTVDNTIYYFTAACSYRMANAGESSNIHITRLTLELDSDLLEV
jgi:hypothetical protein